MRMLYFAVFDKKVGAFMQPFCLASQGAAIRSFQDEVNKEGSDLGRHPEDFQLFQVGEYDEMKGSFTWASTVMYPVHLCDGLGVRLVQEA